MNALFLDTARVRAAHDGTELLEYETDELEEEDEDFLKRLEIAVNVITHFA